MAHARLHGVKSMPLRPAPCVPSAWAGRASLGRVAGKRSLAYALPIARAHVIVSA